MNKPVFPTGTRVAEVFRHLGARAHAHTASSLVPRQSSHVQSQHPAGLFGVLVAPYR